MSGISRYKIYYPYVKTKLRLGSGKLPLNFLTNSDIMGNVNKYDYIFKKSI